MTMHTYTYTICTLPTLQVILYAAGGVLETAWQQQPGGDGASQGCWYAGLTDDGK
jgi:hypothetical protein